MSIAPAFKHLKHPLPPQVFFCIPFLNEQIFHQSWEGDSVLQKPQTRKNWIKNRSTIIKIIKIFKGDWSGEPIGSPSPVNGSFSNLFIPASLKFTFVSIRQNEGCKTWIKKWLHHVKLTSVTNQIILNWNVCYDIFNSKYWKYIKSSYFPSFSSFLGVQNPSLLLSNSLIPIASK